MRNKIPYVVLLSTFSACAVPSEEFVNAEAGENTGDTGTGAGAPSQGAGDDTSGDNAGADSDETGDTNDDNDDNDDNRGTTDGGGNDGPRPDTGDSSENVCGNGIVEGDEVCDDGDENDQYGQCNADCSGAASHCGDGVHDADEACDDGTNDNGYNGCARDCQAMGPYCGDGLTHATEACDDANGMINDGCNPDCSAPGQTLWSHTWNSLGDPEADLSAWPAAIEFMHNGDIALVATEAADQETIWNLRIEPTTGDVTTSHEFSDPGNASYRAAAAAPYGNGLIIVGRVGDPGDNPADQSSVILRTNGAGALSLTTTQSGELPWLDVATDPNSDSFAVVGNNTLREYTLGELTFEYSMNSASYAIAYTDRLEVTGPLQLNAGTLIVIAWEDNGDLDFPGLWDAPAPSLLTPRSLLPLSAGDRLAAGQYELNGSPHAFVTRLGGGPKAAPLWSVTDESETSTAFAACETPQGNILVLGQSGNLARLRKFSANGELLWLRTFADSVQGREWITCDDAGGAMLTGTLDQQVWYSRVAP